MAGTWHGFYNVQCRRVIHALDAACYFTVGLIHTHDTCVN